MNTKFFQIAGCTLLELPIIVTEQYPQGLGATVAELELKDNVTFKAEKTQFNMLTTEVEHQLSSLCEGNINSVILCGIEVSSYCNSLAYQHFPGSHSEFQCNVLSLIVATHFVLVKQVSIFFLN